MPATVSTLLALLAIAPAAPPALPLAVWPENRRDPAQTGRSLEAVIADPAITWEIPAGAAIAGELAAADCAVFAIGAGGETVALEAADGRERWRDAPGWAIAPTRAASTLALDLEGTVWAGLPGDPALAELWRETSPLCTAIESYAVDNGLYPAGPDLEPELVPVFIAAMPWNPLAGRRMRASATPSPGDYRYEPLASRFDYALGIWWIDDRLVRWPEPCHPPSSSWPLSPVLGGLPSAFDQATGLARWRDTSVLSAVDLVPKVGPDDVLWTSREEAPLPRHHWPRLGRLRSTDGAGATRWEARSWAPLRGGAARDLRSGESYVSRAAAAIGRYLDWLVRTLGTAVESYQVDNGFPPQAIDPSALLVPTFLLHLPENALAGRPMRISSTPSPGDWRYEFQPLPADTYRITIWDEDGGTAAAFENGGQTVPGADRPPSVASYADDGTRRWLTTVGSVTEDLTGPALRDDGTVLIGTLSGDVVALDATLGTVRWTRPVGSSLTAPPALLPDGAVAVLTTTGALVTLEPDGRPRWVYPTGAPAQAAPTATRDGALYAPGLDGTLRAVDGAGGLIWDLPLGGALRSGLTTAVVTADQSLYVGREDGWVVAVHSRSASDVPADLGNTLRAWKAGDDVAFCLDPSAPAACSYNLRRTDLLPPTPVDPLVAHAPPDAPVDAGAVSAAPGLVYYRIYGVSCCDGTQGP